MGSATTDPVSPAQAKQRLRAAARHAGMAAWMRRHPHEGLAMGFLAGLLFGGCPQVREAATRRLLRHFLGPEK